MSNLQDTRARLKKCWTETRLNSIAVQTVSFQPKESKINQDRLVTEEWKILGQKWLFLAVCDGHGGTATAEYTANKLPKRIRHALLDLIRAHDGLDRNNVVQADSSVSEMLQTEIRTLDKSIGQAVKKLCPNPAELTEEQALALVAEHSEVLQRAWCGTTLAAALVNVTHQFMWAIGVGDSTVALSSLDSTGKRESQRLNPLHNLDDPKEFFRIAMAHPSTEKGIVKSGLLLHYLPMTRAIGDFGLKFEAAYVDKLFRYVPSTHRNFTPIIEHNKTPPYVTARPSVAYVDLRPLWDNKPIITLFSDGVDNIVNGAAVFRPGSPSTTEPSKVVSSLLEDTIDLYVEKELGHPIQSKWNGENENRAVEVLGNLLGGTNIERLKMCLDQNRLDNLEADPPFHIDDTTIILCNVSELTPTYN